MTGHYLNQWWFSSFTLHGDTMPQLIIHVILYCVITRYVDGTPTSEVTIRSIRPPHHGHTCQYHGHWSWMDDWHPFQSKSIGRPISEIRLFQTWTLTLQGQSHWCGQRARSYSWPSILLTHFLFHFTSIRPTIPEIHCCMLEYGSGTLAD